MSKEENHLRKGVQALSPKVQDAIGPSINRMKGIAAQRMLLLAWLGIGVVPLLLQARSYLKFVTPHKLTEYLVVPVDAAKETVDIVDFCPVEGLFIANAWWNIAITHYFQVGNNHICHFVIPQYNVHGSYLMGRQIVEPLSTAPPSCTGQAYTFEHYFYHGSIGYYAFYEEAWGTYCANDKTAYTRVRGLGTIDINGIALAKDRGDYYYRQSYWYAIFGSVWIVYRGMLLRKSFVLCNRYGKRCDRMRERLSRKSAAVYILETLRLTAYSKTNYFRLVIMYMLVEGIMGDLFLLIAQDGIFAKIQYISLGYNLAGVLSMFFEILEATHWLRESVRLLLKRLIFSCETALLGELLSATVMDYYLTWINQSSLKESRPVALAVSYYFWSLVGHGILVLGIATFIISIRILWAFVYVRWRHGGWAMLTAPCCVDTTLGVRSKLIMLGGYAWENGSLYYKVEALKSFGILKMVEEDGAEYFILRRMHSIHAPKDDLFVIGTVSGERVEPCKERRCSGPVTLFDRNLGGGEVAQPESKRSSIILNRVSTGPMTLSSTSQITRSFASFPSVGSRATLARDFRDHQPSFKHNVGSGV